MATLPDINREPDYGMTRNRKYRAVVSQFGDGYEMRMRDGINTTLRSWSVTWSNIPYDDAETLMSFFDQQGGVDSFYWTMHKTGEQVVVVTDLDSPPSMTDDTWSNHTVSATFKEVFGV